MVNLPMSASTPPPPCAKVAFVGDQGSGKTSLCRGIQNGPSSLSSPPPPKTVGVDVVRHMLQGDVGSAGPVRVHLWDAAGDGRLLGDCLTAAVFHAADVVVVVVDGSLPFDSVASSVRRWRETVRRHRGQGVRCIVAFTGVTAGEVHQLSACVPEDVPFYPVDRRLQGLPLLVADLHVSAWAAAAERSRRRKAAVHQARCSSSFGSSSAAPSSCTSSFSRLPASFNKKLRQQQQQQQKHSESRTPPGAAIVAAIERTASSLKDKLRQLLD